MNTYYIYQLGLEARNKKQFNKTLFILLFYVEISKYK